MSSLGRHIFNVAAGAGSVGLGAFVLAYYKDEGFQRMVDFNRLVIPIALHYKYVQLRVRSLSVDEQVAAYKPLHEMYAQRSLEICLLMRGFYIKLGQTASNIGRGSLPALYTDSLKVLQEDCPSQPFSVVQRIVEEELGTPLTNIFTSFSEEPLAAGSIGQVHAAVLHNGHEVVVKIQYPDAEHQFNIDMDLFARASRVLFPEYAGPLNEIKRNFANEFDYAREAELQSHAAKSLSSLPNIVIPLPVDKHHFACPTGCENGLCTKRLLVMDRLHGVSLQKWWKGNLQRMAAERGVTEDRLLQNLQAMSVNELTQLRPSRLSFTLYRTYMLAYDFTCYSSICFFNHTIGRLIGRLVPDCVATDVVDIFGVANAILDSQAYSLFKTGFVNGDPHPGNIMLLKSGKIGLIDWGQAQQYDTNERCTLARLMIALSARDEVMTAKYLREMGHRTERDLDWSYFKVASVWFGSFADAEDMGGVAQFEDNMNRIDRRVAEAARYITAIYNLIHLRHSVALLGFPELNSADIHRGAAYECLRREGLDKPHVIAGRQGARP